MRQHLVLLSLVSSGLLTQAACAPYVMPHRQLVFEPTDGLEVLERSRTAVDSEGKPLHFGRTGLPIKARLVRGKYVIHLEMQLGSSPTLFLNAQTPAGEQLAVAGVNVHHVAPGSAAELEGLPYSFYIAEADGRPLRLTIKLANGATLGTEQLSYTLQTFGIAVGIDSV